VRTSRGRRGAGSTFRGRARKVIRGESLASRRGARNAIGGAWEHGGGGSRTLRLRGAVAEMVGGAPRQLVGGGGMEEEEEEGVLWSFHRWLKSEIGQSPLF
jgi:hypothetical protein